MIRKFGCSPAGTENFRQNHKELDWHDHVRIDSRYYRPTEVDYLLGDASKAKAELGWEPKVRFNELVQITMDADASASSAQAWSCWG